MKSVSDIIAKALSVLLYPLFVPTYGMALFCYAYHTQVEPLTAVWCIVAIVGTFILTCALPMSAIYWLIRKGEIEDIQIANAQERTVPYLYATMGFAFWAYLVIAVLHAPLYMGFIAIGAVAAIFCVLLINRHWKISAHLTGFGGLFGGLMCYCLGIGGFPTWGTVVLWSCLSLILMYARLYLNAHTSAQVISGWLLGIVCTFVPYGSVCCAR